MDSQLVDRRRRSKRPPAIVAFSAVLVAMPLLNLLSVSVFYHVSVQQSLAAFTLSGRVLLLAGTFVGLLLLLTRRVGWFALLVYAALLIAHNAIELSNSGSSYAAGSLANTVFAFVVVTYFMRKDIRLAYLSGQARGWRRAERFALVTDVTINGEPRKTTNISAGGARVLWANCTHKLGDEVDVAFTLGGKNFAIKAGVARLDEGHVAVAFRRLDERTKSDLLAVLKTTARAPA